MASLSEQPQPEATVRDICHEPACCEVEFHASIVSIEEANLEWSETGSSSLHDLSAWIEYYLPHKTPPPPTAEGPSKLGDIASNPAPTGLACSMPIVQGVAIPCEENDLPAPSSLPGCERETSLASREEALVWITPPIQHFVADTSWPNTVPFVETGVPPMIASATAEVPPTANLRQGEGEGSEATGPTHVRTVTLLNSDATTVDDRRRQIEEKSRPANSWPRSEMRADAARSNVGLHLPSAKDILAAAPRRSSPQPGKHSGQVVRDQATPTVPQAPGAVVPAHLAGLASRCASGPRHGGYRIVAFRALGQRFVQCLGGEPASYCSHGVLGEGETPSGVGRSSRLFLVANHRAAPGAVGCLSRPCGIGRGSNRRGSRLAGGSDPDFTNQPDGTAGQGAAWLAVNRVDQAWPGIWD